MKIVAYVHAYRGMNHSAGGETSLHDALTYLASQGHQPVVLIGETSSVRSYEIDGIPVYTTNDPDEIKQMPWDFFASADAVITQLTCSHRAGLMGRMLGKPVIHYAHNTAEHTSRMLAQHSDVAIYNSVWVREHFRDQGVWTPGPVLHPAVDPERYRVDHTDANQHVTLVNLSTGIDRHYDKGWKTFAELARRNPGLSFLGVRGAYGTQGYVDLPNITYLDHAEDIREAYRQTKVLVVPSLYESFGRVAVEAAASGIPAICTGTRGLREAMGDGAVFAPYGDYDLWDELLHASLADYAAASARAVARSESLWEQTQHELEELGLVFEILSAGGLNDYYDYATT